MTSSISDQHNTSVNTFIPAPPPAPPAPLPPPAYAPRAHAPPAHAPPAYATPPTPPPASPPGEWGTCVYKGTPLQHVSLNFPVFDALSWGVAQLPFVAAVPLHASIKQDIKV